MRESYVRVLHLHVISLVNGLNNKVALLSWEFQWFACFIALFLS
ncbi:hypothetical protein NQ811_17740 [Acinetobacter baumannii]|nr:hypothetical protein [Acinetobacter baumannii]